MTPVIRAYKGILPSISESAFIAETAAVIGDVHVGAGSGIWYGCTIRGDVNFIRIGARTNIQDGTVIHVTRDTHPTCVGDGVTVGHSVILHGCTLHDFCFIGMGATIMDGAVVEQGGMVAAGALITPGKVVPTGQLWGGSPARYMRDLKNSEKEDIPASADRYAALAVQYKRGDQAKE